MLLDLPWVHSMRPLMQASRHAAENCSFVCMHGASAHLSTHLHVLHHVWGLNRVAQPPVQCLHGAGLCLLEYALSAHYAGADCVRRHCTQRCACPGLSACTT